MNKLLVSDIINLKKGEYQLICEKEKIKVNVTGLVKIYLINEKVSDIDINLKDKSSLDIYVFNKNVDNDIVININQNNNSKLDLKITVLSSNNNNITINNKIDGNENESIIKGRMISYKNALKFIVNVSINKDTLNNIALEDLKGINNGGEVHIEPNIECLSNEVTANHLTTIGGIDKNSLNYLMGKGIELEIAKKILLKGFIYSNMDEFVKKTGGE